jgi:hypothetical protein
MEASDGRDPYGRRVLVMSLAFFAIFMAFNTAQVTETTLHGSAVCQI